MLYYPELEANYSYGLIDWEQYKILKREQNMKIARKEDFDKFCIAFFGSVMS